MPSASGVFAEIGSCCKSGANREAKAYHRKKEKSRIRTIKVGNRKVQTQNHKQALSAFSRSEAEEETRGVDKIQGGRTNSKRKNKRTKPKA
jgi:hypothetical protein